jgi:2-phosphosulfolactate phosphatase
VALSVALEWGVAGARALAPRCDVLVIVDVLSFTTAVDVAVSRGARVFTYPRYDDSAAEYAAAQGALMAVGRRCVAAAGSYSLSPVSLVEIPSGTKLVLPSPNGSTITGVAAELGVKVVAGCLRNAAAVAARVDGRVGVIAAGERWPDGSLRPAFEDFVGAGAIVSGLPAEGRSPDARVAAAAFKEVSGELEAQLLACASGQELVSWGFAEDVRIAAELNVSTVVPCWEDGAFSGS